MDIYDWDLSPPRSPAIGDHDVPSLSSHLAGRRVALLVSGGIAAMKTPLLARALRRRGADVVAFCSEEALRYVGRQALEWATCHEVVTTLTWRAEHLSDANPFDLYLVAPATYNTIGKVASGIADTVVTAALASALGRLREGRATVMMAPTMHGSMHTDVLVRSCRALSDLGVRLLAPRDDYGKHNLPDDETIVAAACRALSASPLRGRKVLVTGGPTPVPIDRVRRIVNRFRGRLGAAITEDLLLRGADVTFVLGDGAWKPPAWVPVQVAPTYDDYKRLVLEHVSRGLDAGVFSAGVADYRPRAAVDGKIESGAASLTLELEPTEKVIEMARDADPGLFMVTFKYLEHASLEALLEEARRRLDRYPVVVANRGAETHGNEQTAWIVTRDGETRVEDKEAIAGAICDVLERQLPRGGSSGVG